MSYTTPVADLALVLDLLRERGVSRAVFHATGELAEVEFAPAYVAAEPQSESQTETQPVTRPARSTTGRLVPRGPTADSG